MGIHRRWWHPHTCPTIRLDQINQKGCTRPPQSVKITACCILVTCAHRARYSNRWYDNICALTWIISLNTVQVKTLQRLELVPGQWPWGCDFCSGANKAKPRSISGSINKGQGRQGVLCFIINANVITVTLTVGRSLHQRLWHMKMKAAIHRFTQG